MCLFQQAMRSMSALYEQLDGCVGMLARTEMALWYWLIPRAVQNYIVMRRCRVAFSAGAPIAPEILKFFRHLGVSLGKLYGLTESSGAITIQMTDRSHIGILGVAYPGVEVVLSEDGEILVKGDVVFRGYFMNEVTTREAIDDQGWLHTGDLAAWVDGPAEPELRIIDRKNDIMITAGGKNITRGDRERAALFALHQGSRGSGRPPPFRLGSDQDQLRERGTVGGGARRNLHPLPQPGRAGFGARPDPDRGGRSLSFHSNQSAYRI